MLGELLSLRQKPGQSVSSTQPSTSAHQTTTETAIPAPEEKPMPTTQIPALHVRHYQNAADLLLHHRLFNLRAGLAGAEIAAQEQTGHVADRTLRGWKQTIRNPLPEEGHVRRRGGGRKGVFRRAQRAAVHEQALALRKVAPVSFVQLRNLFANQPHESKLSK